MQSEDPFQMNIDIQLVQKSHRSSNFSFYYFYLIYFFFYGECSTVRLIMSHVTLFLFKNKSIEYLQNLVDFQIKTVH